MTPNDDWTELSQAWTAPADGDAARTGLARQVRRRALLGRLNFLGEMAACLAAAGVGGWLLVAGGRSEAAIAAAALLFGLFAAAMTLWARGAQGATSVETPQDALRTAIRQAEAGRRWSQGGIAVTLAAAIFVGVTLGSMPNRANALIAVGVAVFVLGCLGFYLRHQGRCARRIATHRQALEALDDPAHLKGGPEGEGKDSG